MYILALIFTFPLIENLIMKEHAISYTFDRLKLAPLLLIVLSMNVYMLIDYCRGRAALVMYLIWAVMFSAGLYSYDKGRITKLDEYSETIQMRDYLNAHYLNDGKSLLVKEGWRAWGFLQTLYHRNIYCTDLYNKESLLKIARENDKQNIVFLKSTSGYGDTSCYTEAKIIDIDSKEWLQINATEGSVSTAKLEKVMAANLSDNNWHNGISYAKPNEILFENNLFNFSKIEGASLITSNGITYAIVGWDADGLWIRVAIDKDASLLAYPAAMQFQ